MTRGVIAARTRGMSRGEAHALVNALDEDLGPLVNLWYEAQAEDELGQGD
jgi:hypothetical protein